jgi:hypothetical protein
VHHWDRADLVRRLVRILEFGVRVVDRLPPDQDPLAGNESGQATTGKVVAEAAMLLYASAGVRDAGEGIRERVDRLAGALMPHARADWVIAALCLDPANARDHGTAQLILRHLGHAHEPVDRLLSQAMAFGADFGPERLPHRDMEQRWLDRLAGSPAGIEPDLLARSGLGKRLDVLASTVEDAYAFTHAVLYASDFGAAAVSLPRPEAEISADTDAALAFALEADNLDLTAELLWTWPMLGLPWSPAATLAFQLLAATEDAHGFLPGPDFTTDSYLSRMASASGSYHTVFVMGFLCAAALRPDCAPPVAVPEAPQTGAAREFLAMIEAAGRSPRWRSRLLALPAERQDAVAALVLAAVLRKARSRVDLGLVRRALELAVRYQLVDGPAPAQAAALLRRGVHTAIGSIP